MGTDHSGRLVLAHAVGVRADLPVPLPVVLVAGSLAVVVTFVVLGAVWTTATLDREHAGVPLPRPVQRVLDSGALTLLLRAVVLLATLFVVSVALFGPAETAFNLSPYAFYVTFWVGLVPASLLLGPVWRRVNPLRTLHALLVPMTGPAPGADRVPDIGLWPAAGALLAYGWLELVYPDRALPHVVGIALVAYGLVQLVAALWFGPGWFACGDAFEAYSTLLGRLSAVGRRGDGRLVLRNPLWGAAGTPVRPGLAALVTVLVGTTAFDGVSRANWYVTRFGLDGGAALLPSLFLLLTVALAGVLYALATTVTARLVHRPDAPGLFAHSIVPIAAGYAVAHYFSLLVFEGQLTWILASNPFGTSGVDLFGIYHHEIDLSVVSPRQIAAVQVGAIVLGHVLGVVLAHDRAVRLGGRRGRAAQYPLLAVMVGLTVAGLGLLLG